MRYSLLLHAPEPTADELSEEDMAPFLVAFDLYARSLDDAGVLVSADILQRSDVSTTVTLRDGALRVQDGPFADSKEQLAGTFVVDVSDLDAAIAWAEKCPGAQYGSMEIRPSAITFRDHEWQRA
jgi:hypothetical protein